MEYACLGSARSASAIRRPRLRLSRLDASRKAIRWWAQARGGDAETLERKRTVVRAAVERSRTLIEDDPVAAMAGVAGFEIVAMAGAIAAAADADLPVVLDGVVSGAAAIVAQAVDPAALETAIASHVSANRHRIALERLGLEPYLDWGLRLGEGTGALLMMPMLDAAASLLKNVATLDEVTAGAGKI